MALVTTRELARELGLSLRTVQRMVASGRIRPDLVTDGGHHRYDVERVKKDLQKREGPPP